MLVTMPQMGETVTEGTILRWCKTVGDEVAEDDPLFEVSTDKVDTEVPCAVAGTLTEILVAEGETVAVGAAVAVLVTGADEPLGASAPAAPAAVEPLVAPSARVAPVEAGPRRPTDRDRVPVGARLTRADVAVRVDARARPLTEVAAPSGRPRPARRSGAVAKPAAGDDVEPFTPIRRRTAAHMRESIETAAHTLIVMEVDYSEVEAVRTAARDAFRSREGFALTVLPFVARAVVDAIRAWPRVNATVGVDALHVHPAVHLGIAVDLDFEGLVVPVVRDADTLRLRALARAIHERRDAAHARRLTADDLRGGTFTITNAGGYGTRVTAPIIHQPQVAIVSIDGIAMRPVAVPLDDGGAHGVAVRPTGNLSLSFDHRAFDGAYASAFLAAVVDTVETRHWAAELP